MDSKPLTTQSPSAMSLILVPAAITLMVTLARLAMELGGAPTWLAGTQAGSPGSLFGIAWLPLLFGPWFAAKLRAAAPPGESITKRLAKTLVAYGLLARLPIVLLTIPAIYGEWGTHYEKFPFDASNEAKIGATVLAQLGFWACVWTVGAGLLASLVVTRLRGNSTPSAA